MKWLFDMDGTLVDTLRATKEAYRRAGMKMPEGAWGRPWKDWCPENVHREKQRIYPNTLREFGRILPAADLFQFTQGDIVTAASSASIVEVLRLIMAPSPMLYAECTPEDKLKVIRDHGPDVTYVDDDFEFGKRVLQETDAFFMHVSDKEGLFNLYHFGKVQRWTLSSWRPAVMND